MMAISIFFAPSFLLRLCVKPESFLQRRKDKTEGAKKSIRRSITDVARKIDDDARKDVLAWRALFATQVVSESLG
jgi:hypothetical protein